MTSPELAVVSQTNNKPDTGLYIEHTFDKTNHNYARNGRRKACGKGSNEYCDNGANCGDHKAKYTVDKTYNFL